MRLLLEEGADPELAKKRVRFVNDEEEELNSDDEIDEGGSDSDEIVYDSEEEDEAQREFEERKEKIPKMALAEQFEGVTSLTCFTLAGCVTCYGITVVTCSCPSSTFLQDIFLRMSLKT